MRPSREVRFVCNFSSNDLTLDHINEFATWLEGSSLKIYALDLSFNRIFVASWEPLLKVIGRLCKHVEDVQLGANYLPELTETDELRELQVSGRVSLALPMTITPTAEWQKRWNDIATDFGSKAYDPDDLQHG